MNGSIFHFALFTDKSETLDLKKSIVFKTTLQTKSGLASKLQLARPIHAKGEQSINRELMDPPPSKKKKKRKKKEKEKRKTCEMFHSRDDAALKEPKHGFFKAVSSL